MKIGLIDADLLDNGTKHPNLALMKLSGYHKAKGDEVRLLLNYDEIELYENVIISRVFTFTKVPDLSKYNNIRIGGTGFFPEDGGESLADEIEHHMPDYSLYDEYIELEVKKGKKESKFHDYKNYSIGFATRGCFRKCSFCVNRKYNYVFKHSPIEEFLDVTKKGIYLWDDNFLGYPKWEEILDELIQTGKRFQFRQGLDIRLMDEKKVLKFSEIKYLGDYIFAFDHIEDKEIISEKLKLWKKYIKKTTKLYVLCAYESQDIKDIEKVFERIQILMEHGALPYIMRYEKYKSSDFKDMYIQLARWCNQPRFFKKMSFREFCELNQKFHKNKSTFCSSYRTLINMEKECPELAKKYFDMKYESLNRY